MVHLGTPLGEEPLDPPLARRLAFVAEAVVEAAGAVLPELPRVRSEEETAPRRRPRDRTIAKFALDLCDALVQLLSRPQWLALPRRERSELRVSRARREVRIRF